MNFKQWILIEAKIEEIPNYVLQSIDHLVGGNWTFAKPPRNDVPSLRFQWRLVCEIEGRNVKMEGDKFFLKMFIQCYKKPEWATTQPTAPPGYFGGSNWWGSADSPQRAKKMQAFGEPFDHITDFDPKKGHPLVRFAGTLMGWRPGMMPDSEIDYELSATMKGYPLSISSPGDFRHDMETIGRFWDEPQESGPWPDNRLNTPYEVAKFVKESIDRFYRPRGDDDEPEPQPTPTPPSSKILSTV